MLLIAGLGNPGAKYARNRHNIGFMAADRLAGRHGFGPERARHQALVREGALDTPAGPVKALVAKPQTFMNESGRSLSALAAFHKIPPADIVVLYDEVELAPGRCRVKAGGGTAGHNGLRSIVAHLGADFRRVRLGIGHPGKERMLAWVLDDFSRDEQVWVDTLCGAVADAFPLLAEGRTDAFQTRVSTLAPAPPVPPWLRGGER